MSSNQSHVAVFPGAFYVQCYLIIDSVISRVHCKFFVQLLSHVLQCTWVILQPAAGPDFAKLLVARDMQAFGCLAVELFLSARLRVLRPEAPMSERYGTIRKVCTKNMEEIPRLVPVSTQD